MPIQPDDICLNKAAIIERALRRMREEYVACPKLDNYTNVDALTLNIERACQAAIDLAMHLVAREHAGIPQNSAEAFVLLEKAGLLEKEIVKEMMAMTGFRNVAVHEYRELDMGVLRAIAEDRWKSLVRFCQQLGMTIKP
jgi:uncharacterized protein YutE (UPF0331/DUF86 family)